MQLTQLQRSAAQAIVSVFETGRPNGGYEKVTLLPGDMGRLTYGRFQTTLGSGALYFLIKDYVERPGAAYVRALSRYLARLLKRDPALDHDHGFRSLLKRAGRDPVMRQAQDDFFDRNFWAPAVEAARAMGVTSALGVAVVYDSKVHGSFERIRDRTIRQVGAPAAVGEEAWIAAYVANRRDWLARHAQPILRRTVYRMAAFERLIRDGNWDLDLPFRVGSFRIDEAALRAAPRKGQAARLLVPADPPMKGDDVRDVQARLRELGYTAEPTGTYEEATVELVRKFQEGRGLKVDGCVGPATRSALNARPPVAPSQVAAAEPHATAASPAPAAPRAGAGAASAVAAPSPAAARAKRASQNVLASLFGNLAGPWLTRYSLAPVAAIGAVSAALGEFGDRLPTPDALKHSSTTWIASMVQPPYEWFVRTVPDETAQLLTLAALLWLLVAVVARRARARSATTRA